MLSSLFLHFSLLLFNKLPFPPRCIFHYFYKNNNDIYICEIFLVLYVCVLLLNNTLNLNDKYRNVPAMFRIFYQHYIFIVQELIRIAYRVGLFLCGFYIYTHLRVLHKHIYELSKDKHQDIYIVGIDIR
jgi:hypothetical protein